MSVIVKTPPILNEITRGENTFEVDGRTFEEVLNNLDIRFPGFKRQLFDDSGNLLSIYEVYINGESAYPYELSKPLKNSDEVSITMLYMGG